MQKPKYEVAVLEDGKIVKIYPQETYNAQVIESYRNNGVSSVPLTANDKPDIYAETPTYSVTNYYTKPPNDNTSIGHIVQEKAVKPFTSLATMMVIAFALVVISGITYKAMTGKRPSKEALSALMAAAIMLCALAFLQMIKHL